MLDDKSVNEIERKMLPLLKDRGTTLERFRKLPPKLQIAFYEKLCLGIDKLTDRRRRDILQTLMVGETKDGISIIDHMSEEEIRAFFKEEQPDWGSE